MIAHLGESGVPTSMKIHRLPMNLHVDGDALVR